MKVILRASTEVRLEAWRHEDLFCVRRTDQVGEPQSCLRVDLFEVIAELAQLDLEDEGQAAEAIRLAEQAERGLGGRQHQDRLFDRLPRPERST
jgi:hypothetical protein